MGTPRVEDAMMWEAGQTDPLEDIREEFQSYLSSASGEPTVAKILIELEKAVDSFAKLSDGSLDLSLLDDKEDILIGDVIHQIMCLMGEPAFSVERHGLLYPQTAQCACGNQLQAITMHGRETAYKPCKYCYQEAMKHEVYEAEKKAFEAGLNKKGGN